MRVLFLTTEVPHPPHSGGTIKTASVLDYLRRRHEVHVLCFRRRPLTEEQARWCAAVGQVETLLLDPRPTPRRPRPRGGPPGPDRAGGAPGAPAAPAHPARPGPTGAAHPHLRRDGAPHPLLRHPQLAAQPSGAPPPPPRSGEHT